MAGVDDVFHQQHILAFDVGRKVVSQSHVTGRLGSGVAGYPDELDAQGQVDVPHEVGEKNDRPFEDSDDDQRFPGQIAGDLAPHLFQPRGDLFFVEQRLEFQLFLHGDSSMT